MGNTFSSESPDGNFTPFILSPKAKQNVINIKTVLDTFTKNNMGKLVQYLDGTNITPELKGKIVEHHSHLINNHSIDEDDEKLLKSIGLITEQQIVEKFPNHKVFDSIPGLQDIKGNIINILKNYRFYEYKYIYLNLFLMQFSETIIEAFTQTMDDIKLSASAYVIKQNEMYGQFIHQISDMIALSEADRKNMNAMTELTRNKLELATKTFYENIQKNQMKTLEEVLHSLQQEVNKEKRGGGIKVRKVNVRKYKRIR